STTTETIDNQPTTIPNNITLISPCKQDPFGRGFPRYHTISFFLLGFQRNAPDSSFCLFLYFFLGLRGAIPMCRDKTSLVLQYGFEFPIRIYLGNMVFPKFKCLFINVLLYIHE